MSIEALRNVRNAQKEKDEMTLYSREILTSEYEELY